MSIFELSFLEILSQSTSQDVFRSRDDLEFFQYDLDSAFWSRTNLTLESEQVCQRHSGKERCEGSFRPFRLSVLQTILRFSHSYVGTSRYEA